MGINLHALLEGFIQGKGVTGCAYLIQKAVDPTTKWGNFRDRIEQNEAQNIVQGVAGHLGIDTSALNTGVGVDVTNK